MQTTIFDFIKKIDMSKEIIERSPEWSQKIWVKENLFNRGFITRNECLRRYVSRLADIIYQLKNDGIEIDGEVLPTPYGEDFIYYLTKQLN